MSIAKLGQYFGTVEDPRCSRFGHGRDQSPLHAVSAWACEQGLVLGQRCVDGKSNEITAIPRAVQRCRMGCTEPALPHLRGEVRRLTARGIPEPANV